jgi:hypothetical protein
MPFGRHPLKMVRLPISPLPHDSNYSTKIPRLGGKVKKRRVRKNEIKIKIEI